MYILTTLEFPKHNHDFHHKLCQSGSQTEEILGPTRRLRKYWDQLED